MEQTTASKRCKIVLFWFRRDLRLEDNTALSAALSSGYPVVPVFIFDPAIIGTLPRDDHRIGFIHAALESIHSHLRSLDSGLLIRRGSPAEVLSQLTHEFAVQAVYANEDYEPYALKRDLQARKVLSESGIPLELSKDQVIFAKDDILKKDGTPYTVYTPYSRRWRDSYESTENHPARSSTNTRPSADIRPARPGHSSGAADMETGPERGGYHQFPIAPQFPDLEQLGFIRSGIAPHPLNLDSLDRYTEVRDIPALDLTTHAGTHLRFGTVSIRRLAAIARGINSVYLGELIWREFFMQILYYFPQSAERNFNASYDGIAWRESAEDFSRWCSGETGFPLVDAGMRQLNATGFMHNRVRMITAGFLSKDLLLDWRQGEAYFAAKLFDYEMASNVGNWQWAAGTGCDAVPYFRVFNPDTQMKKFDGTLDYVSRWVPEYGTSRYPRPMVDHAAARLRALDVYRTAKAAVKGA
jgi:deoxyribodipyrimidine photo-lyase